MPGPSAGAGGALAQLAAAAFFLAISITVAAGFYLAVLTIRPLLPDTGICANAPPAMPIAR